MSTNLPQLAGNRHPEAPKPPATSTRGYVNFGLFGLVAFLVILFAWAHFAQLTSAVVAPGVVRVEGERKTIQHLEGGLVRKIVVREGDHVKAGDVLIVLDDIRTRASLEILRNQQRTALAAAARWQAEFDGKSEITFPRVLLENAATDPETARVIAIEQQLFRARQMALEGQVNVLQQRIAQSREEIGGHRAQIKSGETQQALLQEELKGMRFLFEKGYAPKPRILALERAAANIEGARAERTAMIARANQVIGESEARILDIRRQQEKEVIAGLKEAQTRLSDLDERITAATDSLQRGEIRAPQAGTILGLRVHTPGAVIAPGEKLMDLVPDGAMLQAEVQIRPIDVDNVHVGLTAELKFSGFSSRNLPLFFGEVLLVSADRNAEDKTGGSYYTARVSLPLDKLREFGVVPSPGMPVEAYIETGAQSALQYLARPIQDTFARALREG